MSWYLLAAACRHTVPAQVDQVDTGAASDTASTPAAAWDLVAPDLLDAPACPDQGEPLVEGIGASCAGGQWRVAWAVAAWPADTAALVRLRTPDDLDTILSWVGPGCCGELLVELACETPTAWRVETYTYRGRSDCAEAGELAEDSAGCRVVELADDPCGAL